MARRYDSVSGVDRRSGRLRGCRPAHRLHASPCSLCRPFRAAADDHLQPRGAVVPSRVSATLPLAAGAHRPPLPLLAKAPDHPSAPLSAGMPWRPFQMPAPVWASWPRTVWCWRQRSASQARCGRAGAALHSRRAPLAAMPHHVNACSGLPHGLLCGSMRTAA